jgi:hypothetical protein
VPRDCARSGTGARGSARAVSELLIIRSNSSTSNAGFVSFFASPGCRVSSRCSSPRMPHSEASRRTAADRAQRVRLPQRGDPYLRARSVPKKMSGIRTVGVTLPISLQELPHTYGDLALMTSSRHRATAARALHWLTLRYGRCCPEAFFPVARLAQGLAKVREAL